MSSVLRVLFEFPTIVSRHLSNAGVAITIIVTAALGVGGCAQNPQQLAAGPHSKEYFPSSVYGPASRRVIADGQPIPHGGGQYLVGKPYTIAGQTYYPSERKVTQVGLASWYGDAFHGRLTANGEIYDRDGFTAAHPTMPLPSYARVTNLRNGYSMVVRVNDRGPYHSNRVMDVSRRVAESLDFQRTGTSKVKVEYVGRASLAGSDDAKLYATLSTNGPAPVRGLEDATMVAEAAPPSARVASLEPYAPESLVTPKSRRESVRLTSREELATHEAAAIEEPAHAFPPARPTYAGRGREAQMPELRTAHDRIPHQPSAPGHPAAHDVGAKHAMRLASPDDGAVAREFAARELTTAPRPGRAAVVVTQRADPKRGVGMPRRTTRDVALPPSRPVRVAASAPAGKLGTKGSHAIHARHD